MQDAHRDALAALRLTWAPTSDDLWRPQATHVDGLNERAIEDVMDAFGDALRDPDTAPLGVAIRGQAGSGKTHLLGQIRQRVQTGGGFFFVVELLDAASFWESVRSGVLESLGRPGENRETQLKDLLWELSSIAHVSRADRRAIIGDEDLEPEVLDDFVNTLAKARRDVRDCHQTLRALVLLAANDLGARDIGDAYLQASEEVGAEDRRPGGCAAPARPRSSACAISPGSPRWPVPRCSRSTRSTPCSRRPPRAPTRPDPTPTVCSNRSRTA